MFKDQKAIAFSALVLAMLISSGNFVFGNLAMDEISPGVLTFWRCFIAAICVLPFVITSKGRPIAYLRDNWKHVVVLSLFGIILAPLLVYVALISDDLIDLSAGYTSIPVMTIILSAFVLGERLGRVQWLGIAAALSGALVFVFKGSWAKLITFDPHVAFLFMLACALARAIYLVLLRKWDMHLKPGEGLFAALMIGAIVLLPVFLVAELRAPVPLDYSPALWASILFVGVGMGALYLHLLTFGTHIAGASTASLFTYLVPLFVTFEAVAFRGAQFQLYQGVGAALIIGGVFVATRLGKPKPASHSSP